MKNMKVSSRLIFSFSIVIAFTVIVGIVGAFGMSRINDANRAMYNHNLLAAGAMGEIRENLQSQRVIMRNQMIYSSDEEAGREAGKTMKSLEDAMLVLFEKYEAAIAGGETEGDYYEAKNIYLTDYADIKVIIDEANAQSPESAREALNDPFMAQTIGGMVNRFTAIMERNNELAEYAVNQNDALFTRMAVVEAAVLAVSILASFLLAVYIAGTISTPIKVMGDFFERFGSTGNLELSDEDKVNIETSASGKDEIAKCVNAAAKMFARMSEVNEGLVLVAERDLTAELRVLSDKDTLGLSFANMIENLNSMFDDISAASSQVSCGAQQISQGAQELATGSSQQASSIEEFSAALNQLQEKTARNAENTANAQTLANYSGEMIGKSIQYMGEMLGAMNEIDESSKSITKVIKVIDDIAFQTNILALNAAVEAARAGQHGKGFAVVADEVRNLASKSADAAKETAALIEGSAEKVKEGNQIVEKTHSSLESVVESAQKAADLLREAAADSAEQVGKMKEMGDSIEEISGVVQENSASAQQSAAASEEMSAQADTLNKVMSKFKLKAHGAPARNSARRKEQASGISLKASNSTGNGNEKY